MQCSAAACPRTRSTCSSGCRAPARRSSRSSTSFANATPERPGVYLSTVSEPFDKILRYGQTLASSTRKRSATSVFYDDLGTVLNDDGLDGVAEKISALLKERRPSIVVIDSFKALSAFAEAADFRRFLHDLAGRLSAYPAASFWIGEYVRGRDRHGSGVRRRRRHHRPLDDAGRPSARRASLRVLKLRGSGSLPAGTPTGSRSDGLDDVPAPRRSTVDNGDYALRRPTSRQG